MADDRVFKALADPTRRILLDLLFERDGRTLTQLESELEMSRYGVMKHLRVLEDANLVVTRRSGREKLHFLNPVPIQQIHERWIDKYAERRASALTQLKTDVETETEKEVLEAEPPRRLVTTFRMLMDPSMADEGFTRISHEIAEARTASARSP